MNILVSISYFFFMKRIEKTYCTRYRDISKAVKKGWRSLSCVASVQRCYFFSRSYFVYANILFYFNEFILFFLREVDRFIIFIEQQEIPRKFFSNKLEVYAIFAVAWACPPPPFRRGVLLRAANFAYPPVILQSSGTACVDREYRNVP